MTSSDQHHRAIAGLAQKAEVVNPALHLNKSTFELLMHFLAEQDAESLAMQALFFTLQCLPMSSLSDPAIKARITDELSGLPAAFTDLCPTTAAMAGEVELKDVQGAATLRLELLAGEALIRQSDLTQAAVMLCYDLRQGGEEGARYQWQRFWVAVNLLQFLPVFCAWTPQLKNDGTAAGLLWPVPGHEAPTATESSRPDWFDDLDEPLRLLFAEQSVTWPTEALVGEEVVSGALDEVVGEAEVLFSELKVALLLEEVADQQASKPYLQADGWRVCASAAELAAAINEMDSGA